MGKLKVRDAGAIAAVGDLETAIQGIQIKTPANVQAVSVGGNFSGTVGNISHGTTKRCSHEHTQIYTGSYTKIWTDSIQCYFKANGVEAMYINSNGNVMPYYHNSRSLGQSSWAWSYVYYCNLSDQSCADFSHLSADELYALFKQIKPALTTEVHVYQDKIFPHIDFSTIPDEFAHKATEVETVKIKVYENDEIQDREITYQPGDVNGIDMGGMVYAMKELLVQCFERIKALEDAKP